MTTAVLACRQQPQTNGNGKHLPMAAPRSPADFCHACWSGEYPIHFKPHSRVRQMRLLDL
jgi:hypothetical protein